MPDISNHEFNPITQNITFLLADGQTPMHVSIYTIDRWNDESFSIGVNYGCQVGASLVLLILFLLMSPTTNLRRRSGILHIVGLALSSTRLIPSFVYYMGPFNEFYAVWSNDYSAVGSAAKASSIAGNILTFLLVVSIEIGLANQAWAVVSLWPTWAKLPLSFLSLLATLTTIGWRFGCVVVQNQAILYLENSLHYEWVFHWMVVSNAVSIFWYCALFNLKLVLHMVSSKGVLPSRATLSAMEVLIMTNGALMVIPVVFAGLEWGRFINFEASSVVPTSVALILPLGTLFAQRVTLKQRPLCHHPNSSGRYLLRPLGSVDTAKSAGLSSGTRPEKHTEPHLEEHVICKCEAGYPPNDVGHATARHLRGRQVGVQIELEQTVDRVSRNKQ